MRTSKPIATISYNTETYLRNKLNELIDSHKISDYMFIYHYAEQDEKKDHIHLWIKPNTLIDTMDLQNHFKELDPTNPSKALGVIDFRPSQVDDWILYSEHYGPYLASKFEGREFAYLKTDFRYHNEDNFDDLYNHAHKGSEWAKRNQLLQALNDEGISPVDLVLSGAVPLGMASQLNALEYMKRHPNPSLDRGGRPNHEEE